MTQTVLHIDASAASAQSESRRLSALFVDRWLQHHPGDRVLLRDIVSTPLPHLDQILLDALMSSPEQHSPAQAEAAARVDEMVAEFLAADVLVLGVPMYNFGIPSTLKAWIDHIAIAGRTFSYGENGPVGLAGGRQVYIVSTRGGAYGEGPQDHQVSYLRTAFGLLGIDNVQVIQAEGLQMSGRRREQSLAAALAAIESQCEADAGAGSAPGVPAIPVTAVIPVAQVA
jgi:FMN-dependent NADH-azoreductase